MEDEEPFGVVVWSRFLTRNFPTRRARADGLCCLAERVLLVSSPSGSATELEGASVAAEHEVNENEINKMGLGAPSQGAVETSGSESLKVRPVSDCASARETPEDPTTNPASLWPSCSTEYSRSTTVYRWSIIRFSGVWETSVRHWRRRVLRHW